MLITSCGETRYMTVEVAGTRDRLLKAWASFLAEYARWGGHRYHGWDHADDPRNYYGPRFWSEADCAFRLALHLERQFPGQVHLEVPVASWTFATYDASTDRRQFVDIVVSDMDDLVEDETTRERFRSHLHSVFIEAKFFPAGCSLTWRYDHIRKIERVLADAKRLERHLERGRCALAAVFVVDDDCLFADNSTRLDWPDAVMRLIASPRGLRAHAAS